MDYYTLSEIVHNYENKKNISPYFISDWDCNTEEILRPQEILAQSLKQSISHLDTYYFIEDDFGKQTIIEFFNSVKIPLNNTSFLIGPNASLMLTTTFIALKEEHIDNILIILPVYFSIPQILRILDINFVKYDTSFPKYTLCFKDIQDKIEKNSIGAVFITDPFYGSGVNIPEEFYKELVLYANKHNIYIIVDYARGSMKWSSTSNNLFDFKLYSILVKARHYILIDSISKRIFVNGFKCSLLFSNNEIIKSIRKLGDCFIGSMSAAQLQFVEHLYNPANVLEINKLIEHNINIAKQHFEIIRSILLGTKIAYTFPTDGNFMLLGILKEKYNAYKDIEIFQKLLYDFNIYTLPQSLYTFEDPKYYIFRINLLLNIEQIVNIIRKLIIW